jgi:23S rRNA (guanosine2251-2'-O)-methyltransferase
VAEVVLSGAFGDHQRLGDAPAALRVYCALMPERPVLYALCGLPFSGKSTLARHLAHQLSATVVSLDRINGERGLGLDGCPIAAHQWAESYAESYRRTAQLLQSGAAVVYDATNHRRRERDQLRAIAANAQCTAVFIHVRAEPAEVHRRLLANRDQAKRNDVRDDDFWSVINGFEPPREDEPDAVEYDPATPPNEWIANALESRARRELKSELPPPPSPQWPALTTDELVARKPSAEAFKELRRAPISVVLDDVRSLANVGLIFRLCDALRVERLYLCGITGHPGRPDDERPRHVQDRAEREITKTAVMAIPFVPWEYRASATDIVQELKAHNHQIVAVEQAHHSVPYTTPGIYTPPLALILGHERAGVAPSALELADLCVEVPVWGMANSLNVAMTLGLVGYEIMRQHDGFKIGVL